MLSGRHGNVFKRFWRYMIDFMADKAPWSNDTDSFVTEIDNTLGKKYDVSLRKLLGNPMEFADAAGMNAKIKSMKADVDKYFTDLAAGLSMENDEFTKELTDADALYNKIEQAVSSKAAIAKVPYIRPADMDLSMASPEIIYVKEYNNGLEALIMKFINSSNYIANMSTLYKKYNIGAWFFSGNRGHILSIKPPQSIMVSIENAQTELDDLLDDAAVALAPKKPAAK